MFVPRLTSREYNEGFLLVSMPIGLEHRCSPLFIFIATLYGLLPSRRDGLAREIFEENRYRNTQRVRLFTEGTDRLRYIPVCSALKALAILFSQMTPLTSSTHFIRVAAASAGVVYPWRVRARIDSFCLRRKRRVQEYDAENISSEISSSAATSNALKSNIVTDTGQLSFRMEFSHKTISFSALAESIVASPFLRKCCKCPLPLPHTS
ncbi:hypothetical protein ON010_g10597 [Phytophthora cinnamomi]|nr:hypothetical protein ON010_g10597 [Phytophthora cinnamomi]